MIFLNGLWGVEITGCVLKDNRYDIDFNSAFKITGIKYSNSINLPYEYYKDKKYQDVFIYSKKSYLDIEKNIKECKEKKEKKFSKPSYRIFDFKKLSSKSRIANIVLNFDEDLNVVFGVVKKNNFYIVYPPKNFEFINEEFKKEVSDYIIKWWKDKESEEK
jgi:hypothetical protein